MFIHSRNAPYVLLLIAFFLGTVPGYAKLHVVTTTPIFADFAKNVGGNIINVQSIVPAHVDPHNFEPTAKEARMLSQADIVIRNGLGLEQWIDKLISNTSKEDVVVVTLAEGLTPLPTVSYTTDTTKSAGDPHFWLDAMYAIHYVRRIEEALIAVDPKNKATYEASANKYVTALRELDAWIQDTIQTIPVDRRYMLTYHDAFSYFALRYNIPRLDVITHNPEYEPAPRQLANLIRTIREQNIQTVFIEPQINPRLAHTLMLETGIRMEVLYSDTLTEHIRTYIDMMRHNTKAIVGAWQ